jgi:hypothetical protein
VAKAGGPTQNLPKATVQLAKSPGTQPMAAGGIVTPPSAPVKRPGEESTVLDDERDPEAGLAPLAVVCTLLALALMALNLLGSDRVFYADPGVESPFMVPAAPLTPWEQADGQGSFKSTFNQELKRITDKFE